MNIKKCIEKIKKVALQSNGKMIIDEDSLMQIISESILSPEQIDKLYDELTNNNIKIVDDVETVANEDEQTRFAGERIFSLQASVWEIVDYYNSNEITEKARQLILQAIKEARVVLDTIKTGNTSPSSVSDRFTFTNEWIGYKRADGYKVYDDKGRYVGVVFSEDDKRVDHYEHATIHFHNEYKQVFGEWRRIKINYERLPFARLKYILEKDGKFECNVDSRNNKINNRFNASKSKITFEMTIICYQYGKRLFENTISLNAAADEIAEKTGMNRASAWMYIDSIRSMLCGTIFKRAMSQAAYEYALENIYKDYGKERLLSAINATEQHLRYLSKASGSTQKGSFEVCEKMRKKYLI